MKKTIFATAIFIFCFLFLYIKVNAQSDKPYTDGHVWMLEFVQTKPAMGLTYLKDLSTHWVKLAKEAKAQGIILDYKVLSSEPSSKTDWNLMLLFELKNYAALDSFDDKMDALAKQLLGSEDTQHASAVSRNDMREILGGRMAQELIFK